MSDVLLIERSDNGVVRLVLNRPEAQNTFDRSLLMALRDAARELSKDDALRVIVITGAGNHFCGGADLQWVYEQQAKRLEPGKDPGSLINETMSWLSHLPVPVVAQVNGKASGAGAAILGCADVVLAGQSAVLSFPEVRVGLVPAVSAPFLINCVGIHQARRLLLSGESIDAETAQRLGLVHFMVPDATLQSAVDEQVGMLLEGGPHAQRETKTWLRQLTAHDQHESAAFQRVSGQLFRKCLASREAKAGIARLLGRETVG